MTAVNDVIYFGFGSESREIFSFWNDMQRVQIQLEQKEKWSRNQSRQHSTRNVLSVEFNVWFAIVCIDAFLICGVRNVHTGIHNNWIQRNEKRKRATLRDGAYVFCLETLIRIGLSSANV